MFYAACCRSVRIGGVNFAVKSVPGLSELSSPEVSAGSIASGMTLATGPIHMTLAAYFHNIDPVAFTVPGLGFPLRWYGLSYIAGFLIAFILLRLLAARKLFRVPVAAVPDVLLGLIAGTMIGGRLGYVAVYQPSLFVEFSDSFPFWGVLALNNGGMASHGGMVGLVCACIIIARIMKVPRLHVMDMVVLVAPVGIVFGRIANFINGELLGRVVADAGVSAPSWSVRYPQELIERGGEAWSRMPLEQQAAFADAMSNYIPAEYRVFDAQSVALEGARIAIAEMHAGSVAAAEALEPFVSARHPSQLYQAAAEGLATLVVGWLVFRAARKPGVVTAWFLIVYGIGRVATEFIRLPDAHLQVARVVGLSRGQWMSVGMILAGVLLLIWIAKHTSDRLPGWASARDNADSSVSESQTEKQSGADA